jgi:hypothetical protein
MTLPVTIGHASPQLAILAHLRSMRAPLRPALYSLIGMPRRPQDRQFHQSLTFDRFHRVTAAAGANLSSAVDLVMVHNEKVVRGLQPRASLNRAIVVMAVAAWDRFVADTQDACAERAGEAPWYTGARLTQKAELYARRASTLLNEAATQEPFLERIHVAAATDGKGVSLKRMEELVGERRGEWSRLTFAQHLNQWITLRNALAHNSIRHLISAAASPDVWNGPDIGDPYASIQADGTCARYRLWESDAVGDSTEEEDRLTGATVQAWSARSCLAFIIQTVDWLIVDIAQAHGRGWDPDTLRLPQAWFDRDLPPTIRGAGPNGYAHWSLWEGPTLHRRAARPGRLRALTSSCPRADGQQMLRRLTAAKRWPFPVARSGAGSSRIHAGGGAVGGPGGEQRGGEVGGELAGQACR